jgi:hypothetical protein
MRRSFVSVVSLVLTVLAGLALFPGGVVAQDSPQASPKPCTSQEHRRFDFWLGTWEVVNRLQKQPGPPSVNRISLEENGCVIAEHYTSARGGYSGRSLSFYDARRNLWHQTWIDNRGQALYLEGRYEERDGHGALVLAGEKPDGTLDRVTWRPLRNGKVQQLWEVSKDAGETWKAVFDGLYTPKGK